MIIVSAPDLDRAFGAVHRSFSTGHRQLMIIALFFLGVNERCLIFLGLYAIILFKHNPQPQRGKPSFAKATEGKKGDKMRSLMFLGMFAVCAVVAGVVAVLLLADSASNPLNYYRGLACLGAMLTVISLPYFAQDEWSWADFKKPFVAAWEVMRFTWCGSSVWLRVLLVAAFVPGGAALVLCPPFLQWACDRMVRSWSWGEMVRAEVAERRRQRRGRLGQPPGGA